MNENTMILISVLVRILFPSVVATQYYALFGYILFRVPYRLKRVLLATAVLFVGTVLRGISFGGSLSMFIIAAAMISITFILWMPMDRMQFAICLIACFVSEFILENLSISLYMLLGGYYYEQTLWGFTVYVLDPPTFPLYITTTLLTFAVPVLIAYAIKNRRRQVPKILPYGIRIALIIILLVILVITLAMWNIQLERNAGNNADFRGTASGLWNPSFTLPMIVLMLFLWEVIQQIRLFQNNRSLLEKNEAYQNVLNSQRVFAHNIANMIYGFEGVILTKDIQAIEQYYGELSRRCILNNNENANALNHINNPALTSLLLRKWDQATSMEIPMYLTTDQGFTFGGMTVSHLTSVVGVLVDNAIEAAQKAESPRVDITLCVNGGCETMLIANTFARDANLSFLTGDAQSSKPGHTATGLNSAKSILSHYPAICCNQYLRGRYVETNLSSFS